MSRTHVVVAGAGLSGLALAVVLAQPWVAPVVEQFRAQGESGQGEVGQVAVTATEPVASAAPQADVETVRDRTPQSRAGGRKAEQEPAHPQAWTVDPTWTAKIAELTSIPLPAVKAYAFAALNAPEGCNIGWTTLAGIGWVESQHGQIDDRTLQDDGTPSTPIFGPALDGTVFKAIPATPASTALHGNEQWDHAMGPMQFIPSTWATWARDGDGDGVENPQDIDDAAASTVAYLCHGDRDLTVSSHWNAAIHSYNHDNSYVVAVYTAADGYGRQVVGG